jgi:hypothetical protein
MRHIIPEETSGGTTCYYEKDGFDWSETNEFEVRSSNSLIRG